MKIVIGCLLAAVSVLAHSGALWGKAESGASVSEVQEKYPNGNIVEPAEGNKLRSGAMLRFKVEGVELNGEQFIANFYFQGDSLEQVALKGDVAANPIRCDALYSSLHALLSGKYGAAVNVSGSMPSRGIAQSTFSAGELAVGTFAMSALNKCSIFINYREKSSGAAANL